MATQWKRMHRIVQRKVWPDGTFLENMTARMNLVLGKSYGCLYVINDKLLPKVVGQFQSLDTIVAFQHTRWARWNGELFDITYDVQMFTIEITSLHGPEV